MINSMGDQRAFHVWETNMTDKVDADISLGKRAFKKPSQANESRLWEDFKKGDQTAFELIYAENANKLYNYGRQFSQDMDLVKDCIQDLFVDLSESGNRLGKTDSIKFYLLKSFRRRLFKALKKENSFRRISDVKEVQLGITLSREVEMMNDLLDTERIQRLKETLQRLTPLQKEAIFLFYYEGMSYDQIAELFEFSRVNSARELIQRGIDALSRFLKPSH